MVKTEDKTPCRDKFVVDREATATEGFNRFTVQVGHYGDEEGHKMLHIERRASYGAPVTSMEFHCPPDWAESLLNGVPAGWDESAGRLVLALTQLARAGYSLLQADHELLGESYNQERAAWVESYRKLFPQEIPNEL